MKILFLKKTIFALIIVLFACFLFFPAYWLQFIPVDTEVHTPQPSLSGFAPFLSKPELTVTDNTIVMNEENFSAWLAELYTNVEAWEGKHIRFTGSVWKNAKTFTNNEFALVRMMMVCCAADMEPAGILVRWDKADTLKEDEWVEITGIVAKTPYGETYDPVVVAEAAHKVSPPKQTYIYPY